MGRRGVEESRGATGDVASDSTGFFDCVPPATFPRRNSAQNDTRGESSLAANGGMDCSRFANPPPDDVSVSCAAQICTTPAPRAKAQRIRASVASNRGAEALLWVTEALPLFAAALVVIGLEIALLIVFLGGPVMRYWGAGL